MNAREIKIKDKAIGGENPVLVQSMLKTPLTNVKEVINQVKEMEMAGLDIIRGAVPDMEAWIWW